MCRRVFTRHGGGGPHSRSSTTPAGVCCGLPFLVGTPWPEGRRANDRRQACVGTHMHMRTRMQPQRLLESHAGWLPGDGMAYGANGRQPAGEQGQAGPHLEEEGEEHGGLGGAVQLGAGQYRIKCPARVGSRRMSAGGDAYCCRFDFCLRSSTQQGSQLHGLTHNSLSPSPAHTQPVYTPHNTHTQPVYAPHQHAHAGPTCRSGR